jgi:hypothetical protein
MIFAIISSEKSTSRNAASWDKNSHRCINIMFFSGICDMTSTGEGSQSAPVPDKVLQQLFFIEIFV